MRPVRLRETPQSSPNNALTVQRGMVWRDRQAGLSGCVSAPPSTARWSNASTENAALLVALPVRHPNRYRTLSAVDDAWKWAEQ